MSYRRLAVFALALQVGSSVSLRGQQPAPVTSGVKFSGYLQARETWQQDVGLTASINRAA